MAGVAELGALHAAVAAARVFVKFVGQRVFVFGQVGYRAIGIGPLRRWHTGLGQVLCWRSAGATERQGADRGGFEQVAAIEGCFVHDGFLIKTIDRVKNNKPPRFQRGAASSCLTSSASLADGCPGREASRNWPAVSNT